jgi:hypothetical protein
MKKLILFAAIAMLAGCGEREATAPAEDANAVDANAMDANAMDANAVDANAMATPAGFQLNETSWEFTREGKAQKESIDANGNYVAWSGDEHVDHGTVAMKDGKACFDSAMDQEGPVCWTTAETAIGESFESTSDKGEKLTVRRVTYVVAPPLP